MANNGDVGLAAGGPTGAGVPSPERKRYRMFRSLARIGRASALTVFIHWSFWRAAFIHLWANDSYTARTAGFSRRLHVHDVLLRAGLHEFGHALTARFFGSARATSFSRRSRDWPAGADNPTPIEEILIALRGAAVNVVLLGFADHTDGRACRRDCRRRADENGLEFLAIIRS